MIGVASVIEALGRGGAERLLVDTARLIDRARFDFRVYTLFPIRRDYEAALRELAVAEECLGLHGPTDLVRGVRGLLRAWRQHRPQVVHTHLLAAHLTGRLAAKLADLPVVSTLHGLDYAAEVRLANPRISRVKQLILRAAEAASIAVSDTRVVAVSECVARAAHSTLWVPRRRIDVIPNAVDTSRFRPDPDDRVAMRASMGVAASTPLILCVGRLTPEKGHETLLRAMHDLRARGDDCQLLLVGEGPLRPGLERQARELGLGGNVHFMGQRWDVPSLLHAADILALPSLHEGFGLVLAEALASGVPVVASRTGPVPEIVREEETGLLFAPGDSRGLAATLHRLLAAPALRREMGCRGRVDAVARFALPAMVHRLESLYERVTEADPRGRA